MKQFYIVVFIGLMNLLLVAILVSAQEQPPALPNDRNDQTLPPLPQESRKQYYFEENNQKIGPLQLQEIQESIKKDRVKRHTLVWKTGTIDWSRAEYFTELKDTFAREAQAPALPDDLEYKKYLVGVWKVHYGNENQRALGVADTDTFTFKNNGSYIAVATKYHSSLKKRYSLEPTTGRWYVTLISDGIFTLTMHRDQPGLLRQQSYKLRILDDNTLINEDSGDKAIRVGSGL
ncbi:MAG: DUF4339 domain-containing protein [Methylococcales bacterium]